MTTQPQIYRVCVIYTSNERFEIKLEYEDSRPRMCAAPLYEDFNRHALEWHRLRTDGLEPTVNVLKTVTKRLLTKILESTTASRV